MDRLTKEKRSWNMGRIRSRHTKPEIAVRSCLHRMGFRFRLHGRALPGSPDVVLPKHRTVVMVHGCFWHRHPSCKYAYTPSSKVKFWQEKFEGNVIRDRRARRALQAQSWKVVTVWECETKDPERLKVRLLRAFEVT